MPRLGSWGLVLVLLLSSACEDPVSEPVDAGAVGADAAEDAGTVRDVGSRVDLGADAGPEDTPDVGGEDSGAALRDLGARDAEPMDLDAGTEEVGPSDVAFDDLGVADAGTPDAGSCTLGDPCCAGGQCTDGYACLGTTCSCTRSLHGNHAIRSDGTVIHYFGPEIVITTGTTGVALSDIVEVAEGFWHACGLKTDGTVWCWGTSTRGNQVGQLGNGQTESSITQWQASQVMDAPVMSGGSPTPLTGIAHLESGSSRCYIDATTCGIVASDGSVVCWGGDVSGGGGSFYNHGSTGAQPYPVPLMADETTRVVGVEQLTLGTRHGCILQNGEVSCWGANVAGALGVGDQTQRIYPAPVTLPAAASEVGGGSDTTCAQVGPSVYCWGYNNHGQVGIGPPAASSDGCSNRCKLTPVQVRTSSVAFLDRVSSLELGYLGACAVRDDDTAWCWGNGLGNYAAALRVSGTAVDDVASHTFCGSGDLDVALRWLTRDDELRTRSGVTPQQCP